MNENLITSSYSGPKVTVAQMMEDPTVIPQQIVNNLDGAFVEDLIFRDGGDNKGVVEFMEQSLPFLLEESETVAEFAEIPTGTAFEGPVKYALAVKTALGLKISLEMRDENKLDRLTRQIDALQRTFLRDGYRAARKVLAGANVPTVAASTAWGATGSNVRRDVMAAVEKIQAAKPDTPDGEEATFEFNPNLLIAHPTTITKMLNDESIEKIFQGNIAHENPIYKGIENFRIGQLDVARSFLMPSNEVWVLEKQAPGFYSNTRPITATALYSPGGESGFGGPAQYWRSDVFRKRALGVDAPKAMVRITGV